MFDQLGRGLFIYFWGKKYNHIARFSTFQALIKRSVDVLMSTTVDEDFHLRFPGSRALVAEDPLATCLAIIVRLALGGPDRVAEFMDAALEFQTVLSTRAATHIIGNADNFARTTWFGRRA